MRRQHISSWLSARRTPIWLPLLLCVSGCAVGVLMILILNDGHFIYTLDDPYIHLALAENIARGHYGVNLGEPSAPSSSILWPFLLAPFSLLHIDEYAPLVINVFASLGALLLIDRVVDIALTQVDDAKKETIVWLMVTFLALAINLLGLVFTGMEHSLQLFFSVMVTLGLICENERKIVPWWLPVAIVLGPLIRYENLALSVPALLYLASRHHGKTCFISGTILAASLVAFSLFLYAMGLGWLPSSVLAKSLLGPGAGILTGLTTNLLTNLFVASGSLLAVALLLLLARYLWGREHREQALNAWAILAVLLHLLVGQFGWFARYEIYIWATALLMLIYLYRNPIVAIVNAEPMRKVAATLGFTVLFVCQPFLQPAFRTPYASNNIYEQQYQMHRFVADYYAGPAAVNDLGWVSYRNEHYVLDLGGLASLQALSFRRNEQHSDWMNRLVLEHHIQIIMIYNSAFPNIPAAWIPIGDMHLGKTRITPADDVVTFYASNAEALSSVKAALTSFQTSLPRGVRFVFRQ